MNRNTHLRRLRKLYDAVGIKKGGTVNLSEVLKDEGLDEQGLINEADYMEDAGWIELLFAGPSVARLTHAGIKAAEEYSVHQATTDVRSENALSPESEVITTPGSLIGGRYRIIKLLGQGGMGAVYEAIDERLRCRVALKELIVKTKDAQRGFEQEASLLANLHHKALPFVSDHFTESGRQFLVMQFIPGDNLYEQLSLKASPFSVEEVLRWADELLDVLEYLHSQNPPVLHRDIKPLNLKVTERGEIKLLDFGLSKGSVGQMATLVQSSSIFGFTPAYSPIEQVLHEGTKPASDLYALAATLYHLLSGQIPPAATVRIKAAADGQEDPLRPAHEVRAEVPLPLSGVLKKGMALKIEDRYPTATEMRQEIKHNLKDQNDAGGVIKHPVAPKQPDLVDEYLETLNFQIERRQWKGSRVGVNAFEFEVKLLIQDLEEMVDEANKRASRRGAEMKSFEFKGDSKGCSIFSRDTGIQLIVAWENDSLIDLANAKLLIGLRDHRKLSEGTEESEPKEIYKLAYLPDIKPGFRKGWKDSEDKSRFLTSEELAKEFFGSFVQRALQVVRGEI